MLQKEGTLATYSHKIAFNAIEDFIKTLPNGHADFYSLLNAFAISLYRKTNTHENIKYFLDKTPRYYLILPFIAEVFPAAKFIFLFRNPLEILASILTTWRGNRFFIYRNYIDIFKGPQLLSDGYNFLKDRSFLLNYENLVKSPDLELNKICSFLEIDFHPSILNDYKKVKLKGRMGDQKQINEVDSISLSSIGKWKTVLNTHYRKYFSKKYVKYIGDKNLKNYGFSVRELLHEINSITTLRRGSVDDIFCHFVSTVIRLINIDYNIRLDRTPLHRNRLYPYD